MSQPFLSSQTKENCCLVCNSVLRRTDIVKYVKEEYIFADRAKNSFHCFTEVYTKTTPDYGNKKEVYQI